MAAAWGSTTGNPVKTATGTYYYNGLGAMIGFQPAAQPTAPKPGTSSTSMSSDGRTTTTETAIRDRGISGTNITQPAYETQHQTQLESNLASQQRAQQIEAENAARVAEENAAERQARLSAQLQADAESRRLGYLSTIQGQQPTISHGTSIGGNEAAARSAAFARAKEQAGQTAMASVKALQSVMENSGMVGSSVQAAGLSDAVGGARADVNDFTHTQLINDLNRAAEIADLEYQGGIQQRGQNLSMVPSLMGLITASGRGVY